MPVHRDLDRVRLFDRSNKNLHGMRRYSASQLDMVLLLSISRSQAQYASMHAGVSVVMKRLHQAYPNAYEAGCLMLGRILFGV